MLTSKQRAFLRSQANGIPAIFQVGKNGVTPELRDTVYHALEARELVKVSVLDNNMLGAAEAAEMLASRTDAEICASDWKQIYIVPPVQKACDRIASCQKIKGGKRK